MCNKNYIKFYISPIIIILYKGNIYIYFLSIAYVLDLEKETLVLDIHL